MDDVPDQPERDPIAQQIYDVLTANPALTARRTARLLAWLVESLADKGILTAWDVEHWISDISDSRSGAGDKVGVLRVMDRFVLKLVRQHQPDLLDSLVKEIVRNGQLSEEFAVRLQAVLESRCAGEAGPAGETVTQ